ncbi:MAG: hypothetical protein V4534_01930 [Myxococcota bacterium]
MKLNLIIATGLLSLISACGGRSLNIDAIDLSRYTLNLSESQDQFPAYVKLMTRTSAAAKFCSTVNTPVCRSEQDIWTNKVAEICVEHLSNVCHMASQVIPGEVEEIAKFFADKEHAKHLYVVGKSNADVDARMFAMARQDKGSHIVKILSDRMTDDAKAQGWTESEYSAVLAAVLKKYHTKSTIFYIKGHSTDYASYNAVINAEYSESQGRERLLLQFVPLPELVGYAQELAKAKGISPLDAFRASLLVFAFLPHYAFLTEIDQVLESSKMIRGASDAILEAAFAQYQLKDRLQRNNFDVKNKMKLFASEYSQFTYGKMNTVSEMVKEYSAAFTDESARNVSDLYEMIMSLDKTIDDMGTRFRKFEII